MTTELRLGEPVGQSVGDQLRTWRHRRRLSQLALSTRAEISARHLSFVETGRAQPSRRLLLHLAEELEIPLRTRNELLLAAGFAPAHPERRLTAPAMAAIHDAVRKVLDGYHPYPALAVDRRWDLLDANAAASVFLEGVADHLLTDPVNVLRVSLHPDGMASRIENLDHWRAHLLRRLRRQVADTADPDLAELLRELTSYPGSEAALAGPASETSGVFVPLRLRGVDGQILTLLSTVTVFGTPVDITVAELAIEAFLPADGATAVLLAGQQP